MAEKLVFFFGRDAKLAFAETLFFFKDNKVAFELVAREEKFAVFSFKEQASAQSFLQKLGGTVKIAASLFESKKFSEKALEKKIVETKLIDSLGEKFFYYAKALTENSEDNAILRAVLKQLFKQQRFKAMLKHPRQTEERALPTMGPSEIMRWRLLDNGCELLAVQCADSICVCRTIAVTDVAGLEKRDLQRPKQKPKQAISLRLARILLNLAGAKQASKVLDPFCGIGTIMQEALFNGAASAIGIELEAETANAARQNLEWFAKKYNSQGTWRVLQGNSVKLTNLLKKSDFDCVATEPFMGPLINTVLPEQNVKRTVAELEQLYSAVFFELAMLMEKGQRIAFILPSIPATSGKKLAVGESVFSRHGFVCINPTEEKIFPYYYQAQDSKILRRIFVLEKA